MALDLKGMNYGNSWGWGYAGCSRFTNPDRFMLLNKSHLRTMKLAHHDVISFYDEICRSFEKTHSI